MSELYILIKMSQMGNSKSMEQLCKKFSPIVKKYAYKLNYEDSYYDLQLCFIEGILKMPLSSKNFLSSDAYILSYIKKLYIMLI